MDNITVEKLNHNHWGDCIRVSNGEIEIVMTVEVGPRIIRLAKVGGENELYEDLDGEAYVDDERYKSFWGGEQWLNMGGHRLWHSPEVMPRTYIPQDLPIQYEILENGVKTAVDIEKLGIRNEMTAIMAPDGKITVKHNVTNIGQWDTELAPWCITVFKHGGLEVIPVSKRYSQFLSNRSLMLWTYTDAKDTRFDMDNEYIRLTTLSDGGKFKLGTNCEDGYAMYFNNNNLFVKKFDYTEDAIYPDNGCNFETYTDHQILEIESLGTIKKLCPGDSMAHTEVWNLYCDVKRPESNEEIDEVVKKYI